MLDDEQCSLVIGNFADSRTRHCHETLEQDADGIGKKMYEL